MLVTELARRTADMHRAFLHGEVSGEAALGIDPAAFAPEPFTAENVKTLTGTTRQSLADTFERLRTRLDTFDPDVARQVETLLDRHDTLIEQIDEAGNVLDRRGGEELLKARHHGDYHLQQVLVSRNDFVIIDFEGEPSRSLAERRQKYPPMKDVAGMLRSFDYAGASAQQRALELWPGKASTFVEGIAEWQRQSVEAFLAGYREPDAQGRSLWPEGGGDALLTLLMIDKALYELRYEIEHRPAWIGVPVQGLLRVSGS